MIHPTAIIDKKAKMGKNVRVGPYSVIGPDVAVGTDTEIGSFCALAGHTTVGRGNRVFTGAVIGSITQDKKFKGERSYLEIGDGNTFREYVTVNLGTEKDSVTRIGSRNLIMAYSHIAHDCVIGNDTVLANAATLAGYVTIEDGAVIGGLCGVHQFVRVGRLSIMGGCSKAVQDIPPFAQADGRPAQVYGLNSIGLRRAGIKPENRKILERAFKVIFESKLTVPHAIEKVKKEIPATEEIRYLLDFLQNSKRGLTR